MWLLPPTDLECEAGLPAHRNAPILTSGERTQVRAQEHSTMTRYECV